MDNQLIDELKFDDKGLIPAVVQDYSSNDVLMVAYMNKESLKKTLDTGIAHYWSRSRGKLWKKGETSGHFQYVKSINIDCDGDTLLLKVVQQGVACHTGNYTCFYRKLATGLNKKLNSGLETNETKDEINNKPVNKAINDNEVNNINGEDVNQGAEILKELYYVISDRKANPKEGSYTNYLFEKGLDKILKKVGEEASEVIIAAKNRSLEELRYEISDLVYHTLVLMVEQGLKPIDIYEELRGRR
jgi:phosphoribosyl-ATP pyrophosphohydrolase/phosphoribosyl-AMP cyclohydrolase